MTAYKKKLLFYALGIISFIAINTLDVSAQVDSRSEDSEEEFMLEDVVVTAERRETSARKTPISVVVASQDNLRENGIVTIADMEGIIPSFTYSKAGNFVNIRGVGLTESGPAQTNGVAFHLDGAYIAKKFTFDDAFFDLERVEVLRGPQGSYVGQNAAGGAMFLVTKSPNMERVEGFAGVTLGNYKRRLFEGAISAPLSDDLAFRVSLQHEDQDSFTDNLGRFGDATKGRGKIDPAITERHVGRFQIKYKPAEDFDLRFLYQGSTRNTNNKAFRLNNDDAYADPWTVSYDAEMSIPNRYDRFTGIMNWQATNDFLVRVTTAHQEMEQQIGHDKDRTSPYISPGVSQIAQSVRQEDRYTTAEVDFISTLDGKFQWTAGAVMLDYAEDMEYHRTDPYTTSPDWNTGMLLNFNSVRKNFAVFGEIGYTFTPTLTLKAAARYNKDDSELLEGSYQQRGGPYSSNIIPKSSQADCNEITGRVVLDWQPNEDHFVYFSVARGYKPGSWLASGETYESEFVLNKEIGWNASLLKSRLMTSLSVFHMDYDGFQASVAIDPEDPTSRTTENIDGTTIMGAEFQLQALVDRFEIGLSGSFLDTEFGDQWVWEPANNQSPGNPPAPTWTNLGGREISWAPEFSGNISLKYTFELGSGATLVPRISWRYRSSVWTSYWHAEPQNLIPSYSTGDFRLRYSASDKWYVEGYVQNFTDKLYISSIGGNYPGQLTFGPPLQFGITTMYEF